MNKVNMRTLDAKMRVNNFEEVNLGYNDKEAFEEASRCLDCQNPRCVTGCPIGIKIPKFINAIKNKDIKGAYDIISEDNLFPGICGRVCPQEKQCESMCIKGFKGDAISIGSLERYVADEALKNKLTSLKRNSSIGKSVAVVGSGPSGLACAAKLASNGVDVTIYESLHKAGGVLTYGIPKFRLPKEIVDKEITSLKDLGVKFVFNAVIGKSLFIEDLIDKYDALYIATGAGLPKFMGIPGESANGVFSANEVLTRINLMNSYHENGSTPLYSGDDIVVVGGGNVAMDAARALRRMNKNVTLVYRRGEEEMPARREEVRHAKEEGIVFKFLTNPVRVLEENGKVLGIKVVSMELIDDGNSRKSVRMIDDSEHVIPCDMVVMALGTTPNPLILNNSNLNKNEDGLIITDETKTNIKAVFAGGDAVSGAATVILAMDAGKKAANEIIEYLK